MTSLARFVPTPTICARSHSPLAATHIQRRATGCPIVGVLIAVVSSSREVSGGCLDQLCVLVCSMLGAGKILHCRHQVHLAAKLYTRPGWHRRPQLSCIFLASRSGHSRQSFSMLSLSAKVLVPIVASGQRPVRTLVAKQTATIACPMCFSFLSAYANKTTPCSRSDKRLVVNY